MTHVTGPPPLVLRPGNGEQLPFIGTLRAPAADTAGTFRFVLGQDTAEAPQGAIVLVPRGSRHGFTIEPGSKALVLTIPAGLEGFFKELGAGLAERRTSEEIRAGRAGKYDPYPDPPA